jgi:hypothetical protein
MLNSNDILLLIPTAIIDINGVIIIDDFIEINKSIVSNGNLKLTNESKIKFTSTDTVQISGNLTLSGNIEIVLNTEPIQQETIILFNTTMGIIDESEIILTKEYSTNNCKDITYTKYQNTEGTNLGVIITPTKENCSKSFDWKIYIYIGISILCLCTIISVLIILSMLILKYNGKCTILFHSMEKSDIDLQKSQKRTSLANQETRYSISITNKE